MKIFLRRASLPRWKTSSPRKESVDILSTAMRSAKEEFLVKELGTSLAEESKKSVMSLVEEFKEWAMSLVKE